MVIVLRRLEIGATVKVEKRCRTATPWPIGLCSAPLVGFRIQAVMTGSDKQGEQILPTPSRLLRGRQGWGVGRIVGFVSDRPFRQKRVKIVKQGAGVFVRQCEDSSVDNLPDAREKFVP
jgi:hypothetical protein